MNKEEIKEILDKLKSDNYPFGIATIDINKLKDYITNLQQEKEYYENEYQTLIEQLPSNTFFKYENQAIDGVYVLRQRNDYKSRCEKTMELLKLPIVYETHQENGERDELLKRIRQSINILNGSDENETNS